MHTTKSFRVTATVVFAVIALATFLTFARDDTRASALPTYPSVTDELAPSSPAEPESTPTPEASDDPSTTEPDPHHTTSPAKKPTPARFTQPAPVVPRPTGAPSPTPSPAEPSPTPDQGLIGGILSGLLG